jgi:ssDNA-binding Zn-finger/Zn-ribbon topoisomerase 1
MTRKGRFVKNCPVCGGEQVYGRYDHYQSALRGNWKCKKCGSPKNMGKGRYEDILYSWFDVKKRSARDRGYAWDLEIEDVWQMYVDQDKKCALSGMDIGWSKSGMTATASIDRIDSSEGYLLENVQLVHKDVNFMKQNYDQDYFIETCKKIASYNKG